MSAQKVAAYVRWSPARGFNYSDFTTEKILVLWSLTGGGRLQEVIAYERWAHREVQLYALN